MTSYNSITSNTSNRHGALDPDAHSSARLLSSSFAPSSWSGSRSLGVAEVIASYRRSQYLSSEQGVISSGSSQSDLSYADIEINDQEASNETLRAYPQAEDLDGTVEEELEDDRDDGLLTPIPAQPRRRRDTRHDEDHDFVGGFAWDDVVDEGVSPPALPPPVRSFQRRLSETVLRTAGAVTPRNPFETAHANQHSSERTPLLRKTPSRVSVKFQIPRPARPRRGSRRDYGDGTSTVPTTQGLLEIVPPTPTPVVASEEEEVTGEKVVLGGQSTFGQTLFNSIAILLGFGMLSEPLAFAYAGWIGGLSLIMTYGLVSCYTAKILSRIMLEDSKIVTYADIGKKAFGPRSTIFTSILFCLELFAVSVVLVTLLGDSLNSIDPTYSTTTYKLFGFLFLLPTVFFPLSVLSYTSILGILSTILIIAVLLFDGLTKPQAPGSLWDPMDTSLNISSPAGLGVAFGLFMAGFSGHAVLPSLAKDMVDPRQFDRMIDWAFGIATVLYALIGSAGYMMFGNSVSDEVSRDMLLVPGYNRFINQMAVWSLVVLPLTKFALTTRPVNVTLEIMLGISNVLPERDPHAGELVAISDSTSQFSTGTRTVLMIIERTVFATLAVAVSILIPEFSSMMAFLGSFSAFMLGIIGPVSAKIVLYRQCSLVDALCLAGSIIMALWGTLAVFVTSD